MFLDLQFRRYSNGSSVLGRTLSSKTFFSSPVSLLNNDELTMNNNGLLRQVEQRRPWIPAKQQIRRRRSHRRSLLQYAIGDVASNLSPKFLNESSKLKSEIEEKPQRPVPNHTHSSGGAKAEQPKLSRPVEPRLAVKRRKDGQKVDGKRWAERSRTTTAAVWSVIRHFLFFGNSSSSASIKQLRSKITNQNPKPINP
nr:hypothetical protein Iba_scaffold3049CG0740 [Ipomoea batatas]